MPLPMRPLAELCPRLPDPSVRHTSRQAVIAACMPLGLVLNADNLPNGALVTVVISLFGIVTILLAWLIVKQWLFAARCAGAGLAFAAIAYLVSQ